MDKRIKNWKEQDQDTIAGYVNEIAEEMQDYLNDFYDILSTKIFNVDKDKHRLEIKKEYYNKSLDYVTRALVYFDLTKIWCC